MMRSVSIFADEGTPPEVDLAAFCGGCRGGSRGGGVRGRSHRPLNPLVSLCVSRSITPSNDQRGGAGGAAPSSVPGRGRCSETGEVVELPCLYAEDEGVPLGAGGGDDVLGVGVGTQVHG